MSARDVDLDRRGERLGRQRRELAAAVGVAAELRARLAARDVRAPGDARHDTSAAAQRVDVFLARAVLQVDRRAPRVRPPVLGGAQVRHDEQRRAQAHERDREREHAERVQPPLAQHPSPGSARGADRKHRSQLDRLSERQAVVVLLGGDAVRDVDGLAVVEHDDRAAGAPRGACGRASRRARSCRSRGSPRRGPRTSIASCGSRLPVGSSARMSAGSPTIARATATRCCSPPESTPAGVSPRPARPTRSSASPTRARMSRGGRPSTSSATATFSNTLHDGTSRKSWNTMPRLRRRNGIASLAQARHVAPEKEDAPVVDRLAAVEEAQERGLARPARARDEHELAALDGEAHPAEDGRAVLVGLVDVLEHQDRALGGLAREARATRAQHRAEPIRDSRRGAFRSEPYQRRGVDRQVFGGRRAAGAMGAVGAARRARARARRPRRRQSRAGSVAPSSASASAAACAARGSSRGSGHVGARGARAGRAHEAVREEVPPVDPPGGGELDRALLRGGGAVDVEVAGRAAGRREEDVRGVRARGRRAAPKPRAPRRRHLAAAEVRGEVEIVDAEVHEDAARARPRRDRRGAGRWRAPRPRARAWPACAPPG